MFEFCFKRGISFIITKEFAFQMLNCYVFNFVKNNFDVIRTYFLEIVLNSIVNFFFKKLNWIFISSFLLE